MKETNGLGDLGGMWIGKFESSNDGSNNVSIRPNVTSWREIDINTMFQESQAFASNNSMTGYDSHMMKSTEWGAVAYFAHSEYGRNGTEVTVNNSSGYYTGIGGGQTYETAVGQRASTTGNIYGVYDMSGGAWEYVMGVYNSNVSSTGFSSLPESKYFDNYTSYSNEIVGDAVYETSSTSTGVTSWNSDYSYFVTPGGSWFHFGR